MFSNKSDLFARLKEVQAPSTEVKATVVMKPNRGKRAGDGTGTQTRLAVHRGDTFSGPLLEAISYVAPGTEEAFVKKLERKYGCVRVALEQKVGGKRTYESIVVGN